MKQSTVTMVSAFLPVFVVTALLLYGAQSSADSETTFNDVCADCHELYDFTGLPASEISEYMMLVKKGEAKHPDLGLTEDEIALMAEYLHSDE